ncbi:alpha/beta fold hydrolase [Streptomyces sp. P1-3]|uniref:alpha/beta fold hydrolase n=1 Tax=Streptomyces sp. P1-3 TaxID=3421658 RepID=UPI003D35D9BB
MSSSDLTVRDLTVRHGGVDLAVRDHGGTGTPVLLLHGASRTLADWSRVAAELTGHHRVVSMDLRAHGHSGSGPWTFPAVLGDIEAVLAACGIPDAALAGHSLGGMTAALYADSHPCTPAVVNLDGHNQGVPEQYAGLDRETALRGMARVREAVAARAGQAVPPEVFDAVRAQQAAMAESLGIGPEIFEEAAARGFAETADGHRLLRPERGPALQMLDAMHALDLFPLYRRLRCRLLVVRAGRLAAQGGELAWFDELMAALSQGLDRELAELAAGHGHIALRTLDATHAMLLERPREVALLIREHVGAQTLRS